VEANLKDIEMSKQLKFKGRLALVTGEIPMNRRGDSDEVAEAVVWLCSDAASFATGNVLPVDGGWVAQ
jgi:NAD(P)-dependent dehydrogenase (short-subunit alcohol dehydrogenase family)